MTSTVARTAANVILIAAGAAAAYVVVTTPPLRRLASTGLRVWLGASLPVFLMGQVRDAWAESGRTRG